MAKPCQCDEPVGDPREMTCLHCGRQIAGVPLPSITSSAFSSGLPAHKRRRYGPAQ